jgi:hypothetical protein
MTARRRRRESPRVTKGRGLGVDDTYAKAVAADPGLLEWLRANDRRQAQKIEERIAELVKLGRLDPSSARAGG